MNILWSTMTLLALLCGATSALWIIRFGSMRASNRRQREMEIEMADLRALYEKLLESHKRLRSAERMAELREERGQAPNQTRGIRPGSKRDSELSQARERGPIAMLNYNLRKNGLA